MRRILARTIFAAMLIANAPTAFAQQQPDPNDPKDQSTQNGQTQTGAGGIQISGGGGVFRIAMPGPGGPGAMNMMGAPDHLNPLLMTLGELNLAPDFNLSADQKNKIKSIRDDYKQAMELWKKDHADDLKQLDDQQKEMEENMRNGNVDPQQMMEQFEQRRVIMETAPNGEDQATQVKSALDDAQRKRLEDRLAEQEKEREEMMQRMPMRMMRPGMRGGQAGQAVDKDKAEKEEKEKEKGK